MDLIFFLTCLSIAFAVVKTAFDTILETRKMPDKIKEGRGTYDKETGLLLHYDSNSNPAIPKRRIPPPKPPPPRKVYYLLDDNGGSAKQIVIRETSKPINRG